MRQSPSPGVLLLFVVIAVVTLLDVRWKDSSVFRNSVSGSLAKLSARCTCFFCVYLLSFLVITEVLKLASCGTNTHEVCTEAGFVNIVLKTKAL